MEYKSFPAQWFELDNFVIQYVVKYAYFHPPRLTFDRDLEGVGLRVPLEVAGHAGVVSGLGPGDALQHQAGAADQHALLYVLINRLVLKNKDEKVNRYGRGDVRHPTSLLQSL